MSVLALRTGSKMGKDKGGCYLRHAVLAPALAVPVAVVAEELP
jgi:hypothetical protein